MNWILLVFLATTVKLGVQTPGVQIPVAKLKPEKVEDTTDFNASCAGKQRGFGAEWALNCSEGTLARLDSKTGEVVKTIKTGAAPVRGGMATSSDSVWVFTDEKTTLSRIDPKTDKVVQQFVGEGGGALRALSGAILLTNVKQNTTWRLDPRRVLATQGE